jgi:hypothetical protein
MALSRSKHDGKYHLELMAAKQQSMHEANASRICYSANVQPATAADALPESHCGNERSISMSELCMPNHRRRFGDARDRADVALEADGLRFLGNDEGA